MSVVIAGGGQAGFQTGASLREQGYDGRVVLVTDDDLPYQRPPLSKAYLTGSMTAGQLQFRPRDFFHRHRIELVTGTVTALDRAGRTVRVNGSRALDYEHLVLATGCRARGLGVPGERLRGVHVLRSVADAQRLHEQLSTARRVVIVGAGFIGLEVAAAARKRSLDVTVLEYAERAMGRAVSRPTADFLVARHEAGGTRVLLGTGVERLIGDRDDRVTAVVTSQQQELPADLVVVGVGVLPNVEVAATSGLTVNDGIVVDHQLRSVDDPSVSAIGDCSRFRLGTPDQSVRLESVQNAVDQARCVARRLTGQPETYRRVPWFWTEQLGLKVQMAGLTAGHDRTVLVGAPDDDAFSVYCFAGDQLLGVESVNRPAEHIAARRLLASPQHLATVEPTAVRARGFSLQEHLAR